MPLCVGAGDAALSWNLEGRRGAHPPGFTPAWVRTFPVPRRTGEADTRYILLDDLPTLVWAANLANLKVHPFLPRVPDLDRPMMVVFDLARLGLECYAKVLGSKGMQVYGPLNTAVSYGNTPTGPPATTSATLASPACAMTRTRARW